MEINHATCLNIVVNEINIPLLIRISSIVIVTKPEYI
jgi:hypothetical protein